MLIMSTSCSWVYSRVFIKVHPRSISRPGAMIKISPKIKRPIMAIIEPSALKDLPKIVLVTLITPFCLIPVRYRLKEPPGRLLVMASRAAGGEAGGRSTVSVSGFAYSKIGGCGQHCGQQNDGESSDQIAVIRIG